MKNQNEEQKLDVISSLIGSFGKWQFGFCSLLTIFNYPSIWAQYISNFHERDLDFWCAKPEGKNITLGEWKYFYQTEDHCSIINYNETNTGENQWTTPCKNWTFEDKGSTIKSDFNLVCSRKWLNLISQMMFFAGTFIGGLVCGWISDNYGRKKTLRWLILVNIINDLFIALSPNIEMYIIFKTALGFTSMNICYTSYLLSLELTCGKARIIVGICNFLPNAFAYISLGGMAWFLRNWRELQVAICAFDFLFLLLSIDLPESPRWLLDKGKTEELSKILTKAAIVNKRTLPENLEKFLCNSRTGPEVKSDFFTLFKTPQLRKITLLLLTIWMTIYFSFFGLMLNISKIGGNLYLNTIIYGALEAPAILTGLILILNFDKKWSAFAAATFSAVFCIGTAIVAGVTDWYLTTFAFFGKFTMSVCNIMLPLLTAESYPISVRNIGVGANNAISSLTIMMVPFLWPLAESKSWLPWTILGFACLLGGICVIFLPKPETSDVSKTLGLK